MVVLPAEAYEKVKGSLDAVPINTLFVIPVVYGQVPGTVYVDDAENPTAFYIAHPYGMSLLFGDPDNEDFNRDLRGYLINQNKAREHHEWLQVYPEAWCERIEASLGDSLVKKNADGTAGVDDPGKVVEFTRVNFTFDPDRHREAVKKTGRTEYEIVRTTAEMYRDMEGSVIPRYFWRNAEQFVAEGVGYTLICDGEAASTAFSSYLHGDKLEIGIETKAEYRGRGFAFHVSAAIIDHCMKHGLEPVWSCRMENGSSYRLAQRLGFVPTLYLPYYRLAV